ncbi:MAG: hydrogen peroxide-dependent heme synthase [Solirubrobacteraceae bacterium]|jgi:chlorite dismutase
MSTVIPREQTETTVGFPAGLVCTAYAAFSISEALAGRPRADLAAEAEQALTECAGVAIRGAYSTSGLRADCDLLLWLAGPSAEALQAAQAALRRTQLGSILEPFWQAIGVHREAEFSKAHVPAFFAGEAPRRWLCAYPFVRTPEWYLLDPDRRRELLIEHGRMGREYPDVRANTVSAFGLGDYEWLLAFEADDLVRIVDLIRHLRAAEARLYTKNELPFITGLRKPLAEILADLP